MKCWNSAFNAQGSRVIIVVVTVGTVKIYAATVEGLMKKERQDETQFTTKFGGKTSLGPSFPFVKFSFPVIRFMPYYAETGRSRPLIG
jgi:hypothetical protein